MLNPVEIIRKKREGKIISDDEIVYFFTEYLSDRIKDYQVSAWLMAAFLKGLDQSEVATLTRVMRDSGHTLSWSNPKLVVDKHSTGGVGDKTSLVILPLCALEGLIVPMISGRGLGHSGGTLDKLESIPGIDVFLSEKKSREIIGMHGGSFMGQTEEFAPLDKRLYALRDVTGTVESIGLITASILSKKSAEGLFGLVMDVKFGSGAFMQDLKGAQDLAHLIKAVGEANGMAVTCLLSDMNSPLGDAAGNALEVKECIDVLKGGGPNDTRELSVRLAAEMVALVNNAEPAEAIEARLQLHLDSGRAYEKFRSVISSQGGDPSTLDDPSRLPAASIVEPVYAPSEGFISKIDVRALGMAVVNMGGGRRTVQDKIDYGVGLDHLKHVGDRVCKGEPIARIHLNDPSILTQIRSQVQAAFSVSDDPKPRTLISEIIR